MMKNEQEFNKNFTKVIKSARFYAENCKKTPHFYFNILLR